jgi:hypothetical protein
MQMFPDADELHPLVIPVDNVIDGAGARAHHAWVLTPES